MFRPSITASRTARVAAFNTRADAGRHDGTIGACASETAPESETAFFAPEERAELTSRLAAHPTPAPLSAWIQAPPLADAPSSPQRSNVTSDVTSLAPESPGEVVALTMLTH